MTPTPPEQPPVEDDSETSPTPEAKSEAAEVKAEAPESPPPESILVVDVGGSKIKLLVSGQTEPRKMVSGTKMTPGRLVEAVQELTQDWKYDAISIGYPGLVGSSGPRSYAYIPEASRHVHRPTTSCVIFHGERWAVRALA